MKKNDSKNTENKKLAQLPTGEERDENIQPPTEAEDETRFVQFNELSKGTQDFLTNSRLDRATYNQFIVLFAALKENPKISITDLCAKAQMHRATYYYWHKKPEFLAQLDEIRRVRIEKDTETAYSVINKLINNPDPNVALKAAKFFLENNGAKYGFGKKEENTGVLQIQIEDKRNDKPTYTDEELQDV